MECARCCLLERKSEILERIIGCLVQQRSLQETERRLVEAANGVVRELELLGPGDGETGRRGDFVDTEKQAV